jgi:prepilin peptidase CpaA
MAIPAVHLATFIVLLAIAACSDLARRRVPNWTSVAIASAGLVLHVLIAGVMTALAALGVAAAVGLVLSISWRLGLMGGGDVKLAVAVVAWLGPARVLPFLFASALAGGALALPYVWSMLLRARVGVAAGTARNAVVGALQGAPGRRQVPFGVAIAIGAVAAIVRGTP